MYLDYPQIVTQSSQKLELIFFVMYASTDGENGLLGRTI